MDQNSWTIVILVANKQCMSGNLLLSARLKLLYVAKFACLHANIVTHLYKQKSTPLSKLRAHG